MNPAGVEADLEIRQPGESGPRGRNNELLRTQIRSGRAGDDGGSGPRGAVYLLTPSAANEGVCPFPLSLSRNRLAFVNKPQSAGTALGLRFNVTLNLGSAEQGTFSSALTPWERSQGDKLGLFQN